MFKVTTIPAGDPTLPNHRLTSSWVAPIDNLSVIFAMIVAALLLGEMLTWRHALGGWLNVRGAVLLARTYAEQHQNSDFEIS